MQMMRTSKASRPSRSTDTPKKRKYEAAETDDEDDQSFDINTDVAKFVLGLEHDSVTVRFASSPYTHWTIPRELLCRESDYFREVLLDRKDNTISIDFIGVPVFRLYLQWLLSGSYHEHTGFAQAPSYRTACNTHTLEPLTYEEITAQGVNAIVWCVKAAVLAWKLGKRLRAPRFQNHAMKRLFAAYTRELPSFQISGDFFHWTRDAGVPLRNFFEDLVIRNWGDDSLVDHEHASWSILLKENDGFRDRFLKAMAMAQTERAAKPMKLEKYLVAEEVTEEV